MGAARRRDGARPAAAELIAGAAAAAPAALFAAFPTVPQYDSVFHLVWGRGLLHGAAPDFRAYAAPTEHPLWIAVGALCSLLGTSAGEHALVAVTVLSLSALVVAAFVLGRALFGRWPGAAGAVFVGTSSSLVLYAMRGYVDVPFLALVGWAAVLAVGERRRPLAVMALLALAGLLRPEGWVLGAVWWLWTVRAGPRVRLTLLTVTAPAVWAAVDWTVTGDPLFSLHATSAQAEELGRTRGLVHVPSALVTFLGDVVRPPVALLGVAGAALAVRRYGWRAMAVPLALLGTGVATYAATGLAGLSILPRYLTVPAVALCVFAGYGLLGFTTLDRRDRWRVPWRRAAAVAGVLGPVAVVVLAPSAGRLRDELRFVRSSQRDLVAMLRDPAVARAARCGPVTFPTYRLVPDARWILDVPAGRVGARSDRRAVRGVAVVALPGKGLTRFGRADGVPRGTNRPGAGFVEVARNGTFAAYARCRR